MKHQKSNVKGRKESSSSSSSPSSSLSSKSFFSGAFVGFLVGALVVSFLFLETESKSNIETQQKNTKEAFCSLSSSSSSCSSKSLFSEREIPNSFLVDFCRFERCQSVNVSKDDLFDQILGKVRDEFSLKVETSEMNLVNQSGDPVRNMNELYFTSDDIASLRGLSSTWKGVRILIGNEHFFWPISRDSSNENDTFWYTLDGQTFGVKPIYDRPRVFEVINFMTNEECDHLTFRALQMKNANKFVESSVGGDDASKKKSNQRTSTQTWIGPGQRNDDAIFVKLRERATKFLKLDPSIAEDTQVVHYDKTQYYNGHHDYTPHYAIPDNKYFEGGGNRMATLLYYLNDVVDGGHTTFPFAQDPLPLPLSEAHKFYSKSACEVGGLSVSPQKGKAILFYSLEEEGHMDGVVDPSSLHASCPTTNHEKWLANQWFRNKRVEVKKGKWTLYDNNW